MQKGIAVDFLPDGRLVHLLHGVLFSLPTQSLFLIPAKFAILASFGYLFSRTATIFNDDERHTAPDGPRA
jgi:hypothetical protein